MPRRFGLPSVYLAAAVVTAAATAVTTAVPLAMTPAAGLAGRPAVTEPTRPYIVTARDRAAARDLVGEVRWRVRRYYTAALPGFATWLSAAEEAELRADPRVRALEPDREIHPMTGRAPTTVPAEGGKGVTVYVVDTGLDLTGGEFGDRAWRAFDATGGTGQDCTGHGTQVARAVAGRSHGVAPQARVASVRVLGCRGSGTLSDLLAGLDWVHRHARGPAVTNLSLNGADSPALRHRHAQTRLLRRLRDRGGELRRLPDHFRRAGVLGGRAALARRRRRQLELHPEARSRRFGVFAELHGGTRRYSPESVEDREPPHARRRALKRMESSNVTGVTTPRGYPTKAMFGHAGYGAGRQPAHARDSRVRGKNEHADEGTRMQELRLVAVSEDGTYLVLATAGRGTRFTLPVDDRLRAAVRGNFSRLGQYEIEVESPLRPKEIQARIRAGETAEEIAATAASRSNASAGSRAPCSRSASTSPSRRSAPPYGCPESPPPARPR